MFMDYISVTTETIFTSELQPLLNYCIHPWCVQANTVRDLCFFKSLDIL
jgi:hypothetical protein